jgi:hypothetical protein
VDDEVMDDDLQETLAENARLKDELEAAQAKAHANRWTLRARRVLVGLLVVLSCLGVVAGVVSWWTHETLLKTDRFMAVVGPLGQDPAVQQMIADKATEQIFTGLQVESRVKDALPDKLGLLAAPISKAVRDFTQDRMEKFTQSEEFQTMWIKGLGTAHQGAVRLIRDEAPNVSVVNGEVQLNLMPFIARGLELVPQGAADLFGLNVAVDVQLPEIAANEDPSAARLLLQQRLGLSLPDDFGTITLMSESQLSSLQTSVKMLDGLVFALILITLIFFVLSIVLSLNRRRTLIELGLGIAAAFLIARAATRRIEAMIVDSITDPNTRGAAKAGITTVLGNLRTIGLWILAIGIIVAVAAYLVGRPKWFMRVIAWVRDTVRARPSGSDLERFSAAHYDYLRLGGIAVAVVLLFAFGIGWISFIVLALLLAGYLWGLSVLRGRAATTAAAADADAGDQEQGPPELPPAASPPADTAGAA